MKTLFRPPGARGTTSKFKLHDEDELPQNKKPETGNGTNNVPPSKSALKNKKRREKKKDGEPEEVAYVPATQNAASSNATAAVVDPEVAKKLRKLNDKLSQIAKLKAMQKEGKKLEINQLDKIQKEHEVLDELKALRLNS